MGQNIPTFHADDFPACLPSLGGAGRGRNPFKKGFSFFQPFLFFAGLFWGEEPRGIL